MKHKFINMEDLYKEMKERLEYLEDQPQTYEMQGRIKELTLAIVRIQQLLLADIGGPASASALDGEQLGNEGSAKSVRVDMNKVIVKPPLMIYEHKSKPEP